MFTVPAELLLEKILPYKTASSFASAPYSGHCELLQAERTLAGKIPKLFVSLKNKSNLKKIEGLSFNVSYVHLQVGCGWCVPLC